MSSYRHMTTAQIEDSIKEALGMFDFYKADAIFEEFQSQLSESWYGNIREKREAQASERTKSEIAKLLNSDDFSGANDLFRKRRKCLNAKWYYGKLESAYAKALFRTIRKNPIEDFYSLLDSEEIEPAMKKAAILRALRGLIDLRDYKTARDYAGWCGLLNDDEIATIKKDAYDYGFKREWTDLDYASGVLDYGNASRLYERHRDDVNVDKYQRCLINAIESKVEELAREKKLQEAIDLVKYRYDILALRPDIRRRICTFIINVLIKINDFDKARAVAQDWQGESYDQNVEDAIAEQIKEKIDRILAQSGASAARDFAHAHSIGDYEERIEAQAQLECRDYAAALKDSDIGTLQAIFMRNRDTKALRNEVKKCADAAFYTLCNILMCGDRDRYDELYEVFRQYGYDDICERADRDTSYIRNLKSELAEGNFIDADRIANEAAIGRSMPYLELKAKYIKRWFEKHVRDEEGGSFVLDIQQAIAVGSENKNAILVARAGSGKTRTIVAKAIYLVSKYGLSPDELLFFAFNVAAANEINERLSSIKVDGVTPFEDYRIARTFHSVAREVLFDICGEQDKYREILNEDRSKYIRAIIKSQPIDFRKEAYKFFADSEVTVSGHKKEDAESLYAEKMRPSFITIDGRQVKSQSEKIICDYLFEHGIRYYYEEVFYQSRAKAMATEAGGPQIETIFKSIGEKSIKPDFYLIDYGYVWEHWAINGYENGLAIGRFDREFGENAYFEYKNKIKRKREFFGRSWLDTDKKYTNKYDLMLRNLKGLIETTRDKRSIEEFKRYIEDTLREHGIYHAKLPQLELVERMWACQENNFSSMIIQFINKAQQRYGRDIARLKADIELHRDDSRNYAFYRLASRIYEQYIQYLSGAISSAPLHACDRMVDYDKYGIDFNFLLIDAADRIKSGNNAIKEVFSKLKYIIVDEYQDFSQNFLGLIKTIRSLCPQAKLLVTGDDWQAIYRFSGADVEYFLNFENYFSEDAGRFLIGSNYRSAKNIVDAAKEFVSKNLSTDEGLVAVRKDEGVVYQSNVAHFNYNKIKANPFIVRASFMNGRFSTDLAKYLDRVTRIISDSKNAGKILILHRNNKMLYNFAIDDFLKRLRAVVCGMKIMDGAEFDSKVKIMTIHKSKGLEANTVILLEMDKGVLPAVRQDDCLYSIFGEDARTSMEDQYRLFYVALTRAKDRLYVLMNNESDKDREDDFVSCLGLKELPGAR